MWINSCLYCQVVVPVISSDHGPSSSSSSPRKVQTIVFISSFLWPSYCLLIASSAAGWARFVKCDLRRKRFRLAMYWLTGRVRCGLGLGAHQEWVQMFPVVWNSAGSLHQRLHTALAPSADFWYRLTGRGGGGLLAAVPRAETTQPSPAAATRHTLKFRPSISIGLPICNAD